jgi:hypothetical protein
MEAGEEIRHNAVIISAIGQPEHQQKQWRVRSTSKREYGLPSPNGDGDLMTSAMAEQGFRPAISQLPRISAASTETACPALIKVLLLPLAICTLAPEPGIPTSRVVATILPLEFWN